MSETDLRFSIMTHRVGDNVKFYIIDKKKDQVISESYHSDSAYLIRNMMNFAHSQGYPYEGGWRATKSQKV